MKIAITTSTFGEFDSKPLDLLNEQKIEYKLNPYGRTLTENEAAEFFTDCHGVIAGTEPITRKVIQLSSKLQVISRCGVGIDNVDIIATKEKNIAVLCTPDAPTRATAEHTLTLMLNLLRHTSEMSNDMRQVIWKKRMGNLLHEKKVGIIGYGRIGRLVGTYLKAFGCEVAYYDPFIKTTECPQMDFYTLLAWANVITLHCTHEKNLTPLIDEKALATMKQGSWLINVARGNLIDEKALNSALSRGHLAGAALDVFSQEPYKGILCQQPCALLTPHASSYAKEGRVHMELQAVANLIQALK